MDHLRELPSEGFEGLQLLLNDPWLEMSEIGRDHVFSQTVDFAEESDHHLTVVWLEIQRPPDARSQLHLQ
jgi:hypothetical protein